MVQIIQDKTFTLKYWATKIENVKKEGVLKVLVPIIDTLYRGFDIRFIRYADVASLLFIILIVNLLGC